MNAREEEEEEEEEGGDVLRNLVRAAENLNDSCERARLKLLEQRKANQNLLALSSLLEEIYHRESLRAREEELNCVKLKKDIARLEHDRERNENDEHMKQFMFFENYLKKDDAKKEEEDQDGIVAHKKAFLTLSAFSFEAEEKEEEQEEEEEEEEERGAFTRAKNEAIQLLQEEQIKHLLEFRNKKQLNVSSQSISDNDDAVDELLASIR
jgi:hypothetical protein